MERGIFEAPAPGAGATARAREVFSRHFGAVALDGHPDYSAALPAIVHSRSIHWLLLHRDGTLMVADTPRRDGVTAAEMAIEAISASPVPGGGSVGVCKPQVVEQQLIGLARRLGPGIDWNAAGVRELAAEELARFRGMLDQDVLAAMRGVGPGPYGMASAKYYNWLAGAGAGASGGGAWRQQALASHPLFSARIVNDADMAAAVDAGQPLADALAAACGIRRATVRALTHPATGTRGRGQCRMFLPSMADLAPQEWLPRDEVGWAALAIFGKRLSQMGCDVRPLRGSASGKGSRVMTEDKVAARSGIVSAMLRRNGPDFGDRFGDGIAHVRDAALRLGVDVLGPLLAGVSPDCLATPETLADVALWWLFSSRSPYAVARLADRHLARIAHLARVTPPAGAEVEIPGEAAWLPFAEDATIGERVRVENLLTQRALDAEGAAMGHCVADYGWRCRYGLSRILSLKELCPEGSRHRLSTAEILVDAEGRVSVAQHRSHGNGSPPALAREALGTYLRDVAEGRVVSNVGALARMARERPSGGFGQGGHGGPGPLPLAELCDRLASHPWREPGAVETHWRAWGRLLEGPARKMTAVQWAATIPEEVLAAADAKGSAVGSALEEIRRGPDRDAQDMRLAA